MDWFDPGLALAGIIVGFIVGLTGMGGGALMTPILVFFFGVDPLTAVSSDLVASLFMKPVGAAVHLRRGTVNLKLVFWLCVGSVPAAFSGVFVLRALGDGDDLAAMVKKALGAALLLAATALVFRAWMVLVERSSLAGEGPAQLVRPEVIVRPVPTVVLGALAGLIVGMTSVGAGSIVIVVLLFLYPMLKASQLVGTDLTQAIPMVAAAALGHILFGDFQLGLTATILVGAIPGVYVGARLSSRAPGGLVRRALAIVLLASGLKLLGASNNQILLAVVGALVFGQLAWALLRSRYAKQRRARRLAAKGARDETPAAVGGSLTDSGAVPPTMES
jgi:uncharacterized protein